MRPGDGGSRGIGASIAMALADKGADVALTYERSADRAAEVVRAIEAKGVMCPIQVVGLSAVARVHQVLAAQVRHQPQ